MGLLATASVAIDGSKFKAVNNCDKNFTRNKVDRRRAQLEESVLRYLRQLETADRQEPADALVTKVPWRRETRCSRRSRLLPRRGNRRLRECWYKGNAGQADDIWREGRGALWQTGFCISPGRGCLPLSSRREAHLPLQLRREGPVATALFDQSMQQLRFEESLHDRQGAAYRSRRE